MYITDTSSFSSLDRWLRVTPLRLFGGRLFMSSHLTSMYFIFFLADRVALHSWLSSTPTTVSLTVFVGLRCCIANDQAQGRLSCFFATVDQRQRRMKQIGLWNSSVVCRVVACCCHCFRELCCYLRHLDQGQYRFCHSSKQCSGFSKFDCLSSYPCPGRIFYCESLSLSSPSDEKCSIW